MPKITHDPVRQGELQEEQWFADLIGGMLRLSQHPTNVYSYDRMVNIYGEKRVENLMEAYNARREVENES